MKIIAKKGSELEQTIKEMCDRIDNNLNGAQDIVEQAAGVRPTNIYQLFHWGIISRFITEFVISKEDEPKVNKRVLRKKKDVWVPAMRYKEGKVLNDTFREYAKANEVYEEPLHKYGIHSMDLRNKTSYYCQPYHTTDDNRYGLLCSDSIPNGFDEKKLARDQFEIKYNTTK